MDDGLRVTVRTRTATNGTNGQRRRRREFDAEEEDSTTVTTTATTTTSYQYHDVDEADADEMPRAAWGVLFDADERPTERLREVLAALGRWVVSLFLLDFCPSFSRGVGCWEIVSGGGAN